MLRLISHTCAALITGLAPSACGAAPDCARTDSPVETLQTPGRIDPNLSRGAVRHQGVRKIKLRVREDGFVEKLAVHHEDATATPAPVIAPAQARIPGSTVAYYEHEGYVDRGEVHEVEVKTADGRTSEVSARLPPTRCRTRSRRRSPVASPAARSSRPSPRKGRKSTSSPSRCSRPASCTPCASGPMAAFWLTIIASLRKSTCRCPESPVLRALGPSVPMYVRPGEVPATSARHVGRHRGRAARTPRRRRAARAAVHRRVPGARARPRHDGERRLALLTDHRGSVRLVVDADTGEVAQRLDYDAWGRVLADTRPGVQPFRFAGGLYDPATGLVQMGGRLYDPETGRFLTSDRAGFGGGDVNLYAYAGNDPVNRIDPSGYAWEEGVASFASGLGNVRSFGLGGWLADELAVAAHPGTCQRFWDSPLPSLGKIVGGVRRHPIGVALPFRFAPKVGEIRGDTEGPALVGELRAVEELARLDPPPRLRASQGGLLFMANDTRPAPAVPREGARADAHARRSTPECLHPCPRGSIARSWWRVR